MDEGSLGSVIKIPREFIDKEGYFEHIKRRLVAEVGDFLVPGIIDSGHYHVIKLDMYRNELPYEIEFYIKGTHVLAREQHYTIAMMDEFKIPETAKLCCQWCGNVLVLDKRGGCSACGGWPKGK